MRSGLANVPEQNGRIVHYDAVGLSEADANSLWLAIEDRAQAFKTALRGDEGFPGEDWTPLVGAVEAAIPDTQHMEAALK